MQGVRWAWPREKSSLRGIIDSRELQACSSPVVHTNICQHRHTPVNPYGHLQGLRPRSLMASPSIACISVIGKDVGEARVPRCVADLVQNNPLHTAVFPPEVRPQFEFSLLLSSTLDIFEARIAHKFAEQDFGLLQAVDERLACYGWLTNTAVKFVVVVDMAGRPLGPTEAFDRRTLAAGVMGLRDTDLRPVSMAASAG